MAATNHFDTDFQDHKSYYTCRMPVTTRNTVVATCCISSDVQGEARHNSTQDVYNKVNCCWWVSCGELVPPHVHSDLEGLPIASLLRALHLQQPVHPQC